MAKTGSSTRKVDARKKEPWYLRLARTIGLDPYQPKDHKKINDLIKSTSKHSRQTTKPKNWREKRKTRRLMARASRRINRKQV